MNSSSDNSSVNKPIQQRLTDAVASVADIFERRQVNYALIGDLRAAFRGNKRSTEDADFLLHVSALNLPGLLQEMKDAGCDFDELGAIRQWSTEQIRHRKMRTCVPRAVSQPSRDLAKNRPC